MFHRQNSGQLLSRINVCLEAEVLRTYHAVFECCVEVSSPPSRNTDATSGPSAVWLLAVVFERLVLGSNQDLNVPDPFFIKITGL